MTLMRSSMDLFCNFYIENLVEITDLGLSIVVLELNIFYIEISID